MSGGGQILTFAKLAVGILNDLIRPHGRRVNQMMTSSNRSNVCWICGKVVSLEECKVDEHGLAVHEDCYVVLILWQKEVVPQKTA